MQGTVLAEGRDSRLQPTTRMVDKLLILAIDKPRICYPFSAPCLTGLLTILAISGTRDLARFEGLLGDGGRRSIRGDGWDYQVVQGKRAVVAKTDWQLLNDSALVTRE